jgi:flagellar biosynthesis/type III secretory pathway M-ring protein FliF/YscJ
VYVNNKKGKRALEKIEKGIRIAFNYFIFTIRRISDQQQQSEGLLSVPADFFPYPYISFICHTFLFNLIIFLIFKMNYNELIAQAEKNARKQERQVRKAECELEIKRQMQMERMAIEKTRRKEEIKRKLPRPPKEEPEVSSKYHLFCIIKLF